MKYRVRLKRISFELLAFLVLVVLKLDGAIDWSWWWVTAILWSEAIIFIGQIIVTSVIIYLANRLDQ
jgi:hypothetical protein